MENKVRKSKRLGDLTLRLAINGASALVIALFLLFAETFYFKWIFAAAVAALSGVALWEYYQLLKKKELNPAIWLGVLSGIFYVYAIFLKTQSLHPLLQNAPSFILGFTFFLSFFYFALKGKSPTINIATTFMGLVYIAIPLALLLRIVYFFAYERQEDPLFAGTWWLLYLLVVTKSADMGGYFIGRRFGRKKLAFKLSPNKTIEGALGGLIASILMSFFILFLGKAIGGVFQKISYLIAFWLGILMGILGQMGDLAESLLKRDAKVKDSNKIPGVGGILDMVDSILFTSPFLYLFLKVHYLGS